METKRLIAPRNVAQGVEAWVDPVVIPTYPAMPADKNPMFLERRVYQGSSGKVYPLPFTDRVSHEKEDRTYNAIHIENEFLYVMILPELGGRIHVARDKTNGYDFIYRQSVIKPALVGLAGPWISGGIEINWPQHHRPSTYMPCEFSIEECEDGSKTVWLSEHEPMNRMKGMHGVSLRPGNACLELKGRIYNRTPFVQTFLWWANVGVHVNDHYQSFFPADVHYVADHAKRATSTFPECTGFYYGVDYRPATRLDWYKNIPVPASYMVLHSDFDFFGGYDHGKRAGFVHVADRHMAPGKKQWTWGNHPFGWAWDRNLTDSDGPYVELMAGVYTDNQPDFSFLAPYESRSFVQRWYPIQEIGPVSNATEHAAISLRLEEGEAFVGISSAYSIHDGIFEITEADRTEREEIAVAPGRPWTDSFEVDPDTPAHRVTVRLLDNDGFTLVEFTPPGPPSGDPPSPATEPAAPEEIATLEELYLAGVHLAQYRHATRKPEDYWREALRRDPLDSRCNTAMADWHLRRGEYESAETYSRRAIERLIQRNPNPSDGEPFYILGMALEWQGRKEDAYGAYSKATWNYAWASAAHYRLGCLDAVADREPQAIDHLMRSDHPGSRILRACLARKDENAHLASRLLDEVLEGDPLDHWALREMSFVKPSVTSKARYGDAMRGDPQNYLDLAIDYAGAGQFDDALATLNECSGDHPMIGYAKAFYLSILGRDDESVKALGASASASPDYCFPSRLEEIEFLGHAISANPTDAKAPYYLGNLLYDRRRYEEAIKSWERSVAIDPTFSIPCRNLGIAYFNFCRDSERAREAYDRAVAADPHDARLVYERDQLLKRTGETPTARLAKLEQHRDLVLTRDDATLELCALYSQTGTPEKALAILKDRRFAPWEGGEGVALGEWVRTNLLLGRRALASGDHAGAIRYFGAAEQPPENLGEARHLLANASDVWFHLGKAYHADGQDDRAREWWTKAAEFRGDFQEMSVRPFSEMTHYQALSLRRLDRDKEAEHMLEGLLDYARGIEIAPAKIDYFATSLPTMLLFEDDLQQRNAFRGWLLQAQAEFGLGHEDAARTLLDRLLELDPNNRYASDLE